MTRCLSKRQRHAVCNRDKIYWQLEDKLVKQKLLARGGVKLHRCPVETTFLISEYLRNISLWPQICFWDAYIDVQFYRNIILIVSEILDKQSVYQWSKTQWYWYYVTLLLYWHRFCTFGYFCLVLFQQDLYVRYYWIPVGFCIIWDPVISILSICDGLGWFRCGQFSYLLKPFGNCE